MHGSLIEMRLRISLIMIMSNKLNYDQTRFQDCSMDLELIYSPPVENYSYHKRYTDMKRYMYIDMKYYNKCLL